MTLERHCQGLKEGYLLHVKIGEVIERGKELSILLWKQEKEGKKCTREEREKVSGLLRRCFEVRDDTYRIFCKNGWDLHNNGTDCSQHVARIFQTGTQILQDVDFVIAEIGLSLLVLAPSSKGGEGIDGAMQHLKLN